MNRKKPEAVAMRNAGYSYAMIKNELDISLSTLSSWFKDQSFTPNATVQQRMKEGRYSYGLQRKEERIAEIQKMKELGRCDIGTLSKRDLWMIGLGLWIGEGSKTTEQLRLANSDPQVIALWVRWLKEIGGFQESDIFLTMHLYKDSDEERSRAYWRGVVGQDVRFGKTQTDKRVFKNSNKRGKLPYGTLHVSARSGGGKEKGVKFYRRFKGWVSAILDNASEMRA